MQMKVLIAIYFIWEQSGRRVGFELRRDLGRELPARRRIDSGPVPAHSGLRSGPPPGVLRFSKPDRICRWLPNGQAVVHQARCGGIKENGGPVMFNRRFHQRNHSFRGVPVHQVAFVGLEPPSDMLKLGPLFSMGQEPAESFSKDWVRVADSALVPTNRRWSWACCHASARKLKRVSRAGVSCGRGVFNSLGVPSAGRDGSGFFPAWAAFVPGVFSAAEGTTDSGTSGESSTRTSSPRDGKATKGPVSSLSRKRKWGQWALNSGLGFATGKVAHFSQRVSSPTERWA